VRPSSGIGRFADDESAKPQYSRLHYERELLPCQFAQIGFELAAVPGRPSTVRLDRTAARLPVSCLAVLLGDDRAWTGALRNDKEAIDSQTGPNQDREQASGSLAVSVR